MVSVVSSLIHFYILRICLSCYAHNESGIVCTSVISLCLFSAVVLSFTVEPSSDLQSTLKHFWEVFYK